MAPAPEDIKNLADLINSHIDQMWVVPLAILGEIYVSHRYFNLLKSWLLIGSVLLLILSLLTGYLARGATITMFKASLGPDFNLDIHYNTAALFAFVQMGALFLGSILFFILFYRNRTKFGGLGKQRSESQDG